MSQNRPPPAYQEFAASMLANIHFRMLLPAERGLLYTMRLECWVNNGLPANPVMLAKVIGFPSEDVAAALPLVMHFFEDQGGLLICPELEQYRDHLKGIREKQKEGGKRGADLTNGKRKTAAAEESSCKATGNPRVARASTRASLVQFNPIQSNPVKSKTQSSEEGINHFRSDYESASNGR